MLSGVVKGTSCSESLCDRVVMLINSSITLLWAAHRPLTSCPHQSLVNPAAAAKSSAFNNATPARTSSLQTAFLVLTGQAGVSQYLPPMPLSFATCN